MSSLVIFTTPYCWTFWAAALVVCVVSIFLRKHILFSALIIEFVLVDLFVVFEVLYGGNYLEIMLFTLSIVLVNIIIVLIKKRNSTNEV